MAKGTEPARHGARYGPRVYGSRAHAHGQFTAWSWGDHTMTARTEDAGTEGSLGAGRGPLWGPGERRAFPEWTLNAGEGFAGRSRKTGNPRRGRRGAKGASRVREGRPSL